MTDQELIDKIHELARTVSYYNAAEREAYYAEWEARGEAKRKLREAREEAAARNLTVDLKGYLL